MNVKQCIYCHKFISINAHQCPYCGNWQSQQYNYNSPIPRPQTRQTESLILGLASLICCTIWALPFAIVAYEKSRNSEKLWQEGNLYESQMAAKKADTNFKIGFWVAVVPILISFFAAIIVWIIFGAGVIGIIANYL